MRRLVVFVFALALLLAGGPLPADPARAGSIPIGGPNPNWTDMQKFEWYIGRMATAAQMCAAHEEAGVLNRLARMSPYGGIGLGQMRGDDFYGPACVEIAADAKDLVADAAKIEAYLEATYGCKGEGCFGQTLSSWQTHACAETLKGHLADHAVPAHELNEVTFSQVIVSSGQPDYQVRIRFKNCQGALYVELSHSCRVVKDYTRGDCAVAGVAAY